MINFGNNRQNRPIIRLNAIILILPNTSTDIDQFSVQMILWSGECDRGKQECAM